MYLKLKHLVLASFIIACSSFSAVAQQSKFEDWVRICEEKGAFSGRCYISQRLTLKDTGVDLFSLGIGYPLENKHPLMLLSAPLGIFLPSGIKFSVDSLQEVTSVVAYCNKAGCHAYYRMTANLIKEFRQGRWINVTFLDGTRKPHHFQVSLNGFTSAIASLSNISISE